MAEYKAVVETMKENVQKFVEEDNGYYIHLGMVQKVAESDRNGKIYISIYCYTLNGKYKGSYKCGSVDKETGEYSVSKWDDVNAETMAWLG